MAGEKGSIVWDVLYSRHDSLFADRVMKEEDWSRLRRATYRHKLQPCKLARVMLGYFWILVYVAVLTVAVGLYSSIAVQYYGWPMLSLQSVQTFFSAITFALTLLLVFKTNSSYARWWEARKDVGQLVSCAHNLVRQAVAYFPAEQSQLTRALARWTSAAMWVVKSMVRPGSQLRDELSEVLLPQELDWLMAQPHKPLALGQALSSIVAAAEVDPMVKWRLDAMLTLYTFEFGACGRIYNTAIPFCYSRHTSRFLMTYLTVIPFLLWPMSGWASPVLAVVIAFLLLGLENIGAFIEEPFHVIAFDAFCVAVHRDIWNMLKLHTSGGDEHSAAHTPVIGGLNSPDELHSSAANGPSLGTGTQDPMLPSSVAGGVQLCTSMLTVHTVTAPASSTPGCGISTTNAGMPAESKADVAGTVNRPASGCPVTAGDAVARPVLPSPGSTKCLLTAKQQVQSRQINRWQ